MPEQNPPYKLQVFLCHASFDKVAVRALYQTLKAESWLSPWLDEEELIAGQDWEREITRAVKNSDAVIVCLSQKAVTEAGFRHREIKFALDKAEEQPSDQIFIIPIKLEDCQLPDRLQHLHTINYFEERGQERLLRALRVRAEKKGIRVELNPTQKAVETEQERLLRELEDLVTTHQRRMEIGERLNEIGDTRPGVGVRGEDGVPDIEWLPVAPGGKLAIENKIYTVQPFYIAKYPVTYAQYTAFVEAEDGYNNLAWWQGLPKEYQRQKLNEQRNKAWNSPRDRISWYQSVAFTRWLNHWLQGQQLPDPENKLDQPLIIGQNAQVRLPTEWEWQWAAQDGNLQQPYPWGKWQEGYANTDQANLNQTVAVGMYPHAATVCGALDMSGNLWEWCLNKYSRENLYPVLRGGVYYGNANIASCTHRFSFNPDSDDNFFGFRVVVSSHFASPELVHTTTHLGSPRPLTAQPLKPEQEYLLRELEDLHITHERRRDIGDRLNLIGDTRPGVGVREDGTPDIVWLSVAPGGEIEIEGEIHKVQRFYIAKYQITYAQFEAFVKAKDGFDNPVWWEGMPEEYQKQKLLEQRTKFPNNPRDTVSWYQSVAFTRWLDHRMRGQTLSSPEDETAQPFVIGQNAQVRLPTEWEWQWAAQGGKEQRSYPWGEWQKGYTNTRLSGLGRAIAVGMYPHGAARCGALDMSGNLWEWCLNRNGKEQEHPVVRGGSFYYREDGAATLFRLSNHPGNNHLYFGLRVVVSSPIAPADL